MVNTIDCGARTKKWPVLNDSSANQILSFLVEESGTALVPHHHHHYPQPSPNPFVEAVCVTLIFSQGQG